jgi:hypothetical protein
MPTTANGRLGDDQPNQIRRTESLFGCFPPSAAELRDGQLQACATARLATVHEVEY